ncbi:uncharacterized protein [Littorina saxatilis]|uniref:uncharacterized protein n=1 Tax=Littorina saxatilis TaxID=31220 RepID=UPI0038B5BF40
MSDDWDLWMSRGKELGLKDKDLTGFVREQQNIARDERKEKREAESARLEVEKEHAKLETEKELARLEVEKEKEQTRQSELDLETERVKKERSDGKLELELQIQQGLTTGAVVLEVIEEAEVLRVQVEDNAGVHTLSD